MLRPALQHPLQHADELQRAVFGRPVGLPILPRIQIHHGLGVECRGVRIVGIVAGQHLHRGRVIARQLLAIGLIVFGVARRQRLHVPAFVRWRVRRQRSSLGDGVPGVFFADRFRLVVDMTAPGKRDAPPRHRRRRIGIGGTLKHALRFVVIKHVNQRQSAIEKLLRRRRLRLNGKMEITESGYGRASRRSFLVRRVRVLAVRRQTNHQQNREISHLPASCLVNGPEPHPGL